MNKKILSQTIFTIFLCVFIAALGMRVPNISRPHSPKPHFRAVVENVSKASQEIGKKSVSVVAVLTEAVELFSPQPVESSHQQGWRNLSTNLISNASRAPPLHS